MKLCTVLFVSALAVPDFEKLEFKTWADKHAKNYPTVEEEEFRFGIYQNNMKSIESE